MKKFLTVVMIIGMTMPFMAQDTGLGRVKQGHELVKTCETKYKITFVSGFIPVLSSYEVCTYS